MQFELLFNISFSSSTQVPLQTADPYQSVLIVWNSHHFCGWPARPPADPDARVINLWYQGQFLQITVIFWLRNLRHFHYIFSTLCCLYFNFFSLLPWILYSAHWFPIPKYSFSFTFVFAFWALFSAKKYILLLMSRYIKKPLICFQCRNTNMYSNPGDTPNKKISLEQT